MTSFGVSLLGLTQQPEDEDMQQRFADTLRWAHHAESVGFDYLTTGQHFLTAPLQQLQALPVLTRLIPETQRVGFVATLLAPLYSPVYLAETLGSMDILSGGRITVSFALGYRDEEYAAFGVQRKDRVARMNAMISTLRQLWSGDEVTRTEPWWALDRARVTLRPVQRPHPPIWIAANSDAAVARAARWGLPWNINSHSDLATIDRQVTLYRKAAKEAGHDPSTALPLERELYCGRNNSAALEEAGPFLAEKYSTYHTWGQHKALPKNDDFTVPLHELMKDRFVIGDANHCVSELRRYLNLGVNRMHFRMNWPGMGLQQALDSMTRVAEHVLPALRE